MKLWDKGTATQKSIEDFTVGHDREYDRVLAAHDVIGSIAHAMMLAEVGLITHEEAVDLVRELRAIHDSIRRGDFRIDPSAEDVHSQVEAMLTQALGETGKKIHTGRSRNDQVLLDLKLYFRQRLAELSNTVERLFTTLMHSAETHAAALLPGYTHFQIAMPSSFGLWFSAYAESLVDDMHSLIAAFSVVNKNPLGSAAGYGSSFALNRTRTTQLLGFAHLNVSSVYAQMTRGKSELVCANAIATFAATLARMSYDLCLYSSQNFAFVRLPADYTTGSSIMPHKANPDVFELIRARCNSLQALPNDIRMVTSNLPSGYHRDFQILKELIMPAFDELEQCIGIATEALQLLEINSNILDDPRYELMFSVDAVHQLVQQGHSFRDAYRTVADDIQHGRFVVPTSIKHTHEGSSGSLRLDLIKAQFESVMASLDTNTYKQAETALLAEDLR